MVMTRKRAAADSCMSSGSQDKDTLSLDSCPHSNLNLLASSASSEAMSSGTSRKTAASACDGSSNSQGSAGFTSTCVAQSLKSTPQQAVSQTMSSKLSKTVIASPEPTSVSGSATLPSGKFTGQSASFTLGGTAHSTVVNCVPSPAVNSVPSSGVNTVQSAGSVNIVPSTTVNIVPATAVNIVPATAVNSIPSAALTTVSSVAVNIVSPVAGNIVLPTAVQGVAGSSVRCPTVASSGAEKAAGIKQYKIVYRSTKPVSPGAAKSSSAPTTMGLNSVFHMKTPTTTSVPAVPSAFTLCAAPSKDGGPPRQFLVPISGTMPGMVSSATSLLSPTKAAIKSAKQPAVQSSGSLSTYSSAPVTGMPLPVSAAVDSSISVLNVKDTTILPVIPALVPATASMGPTDTQPMSMFQALFQLANTAKAHMTSNSQANSGRVDVTSSTQAMVDVSSHTLPHTAMSSLNSSGASNSGQSLSTIPIHSLPSTPQATPSQHAVTSVPLTAPTPQRSLNTTPLLDGESVSWDRQSTLKLIELYKEHQIFLTDHHYKKKSVWDLIARKLRQNLPDSPPFCWNHVENKWKNMTKKYRDCVDLRLRGNATSKCSFFKEISAVYNYPDEDQKKAAEGLRALKSATRRLSGQMPVNSSSDSVNQGNVLNGAAVTTKMETISPEEIPTDVVGQTSEMEPLLVKKKKYAHLDRQPVSYHISSTAPRPILPRPMPASGDGDGDSVEEGKEVDVDIVTLLEQLRGDRARQDQIRMERLEQMHKEKMVMFGRFLDILQQFKPS